jgi:hypothetical protein
VGTDPNALPVLSYFDVQLGRQVVVRSSVTVVDLVNHRVTFVLDGASRPLLTRLNNTVFTVAIPVTVTPPPVDSTPANQSFQAGILLLDDRGGLLVSETLLARAEAARPALEGGRRAFGLDGLGISGGNGPGDGFAAGSAEAGPLRELPVVPPVLTDLPGVTLTPANTDTPVTPPPPMPPPTPRPSGGEETEEQENEAMPSLLEAEIAEADSPLSGGEQLLLAALAPLVVGGVRGGRERGRRRGLAIR